MRIRDFLGALTPVEVVTLGVMVLAVALLLGWDVLAALLESNHDATESHFLWLMAQRHHWLPPVFGAVEVGLWLHFFYGYWRYRA